MRNFAFLSVGMVLLLLQGNLFRVLGHLHVPGLVPSLVLPLILFMGVHEYSLVRGGAVAFAFGYLTDLIGIAPVGLYTFTSVALFLLARIAGVRLAAQTTMMQVALATAFAVIQCLMVLILLAIFEKDALRAYMPRTLYPLALPHVLATGAIAPFVFKLAERIHALTTAGARGAEPGGNRS
jgi:rod shape-determining protein MreD